MDGGIARPTHIRLDGKIGASDIIYRDDSNQMACAPSLIEKIDGAKAPRASGEIFSVSSVGAGTCVNLRC
jgi:hypothetical protein